MSDYKINNENAEPEEENIDLDDVSYDPNARFQTDEEHFVQVKEVLDRNDRLGHFSADYTKLLEIWRATHKREVYFVNISKIMRAELEDLKQKLENSEHLVDENQKTLQRLNNDVRESFRLVDEAHAREQLTQEKLDSLRLQVTQLSQELEINKKMGDQDQEQGIMAKNKEVLIKEKERLMAELLVAKGKLTKAGKLLKESENKVQEEEEKVIEFKTTIETLNSEKIKEKRLKDKLESDLQIANNNLLEKTKELQNQQNQTSNLQKHIVQLEIVIKDQKGVIEKLNKDLSEAIVAQKSTKSELESQFANVARLNTDLANKLRELKVKEDEIQHLKLDEQKLRTLKDNVQRRLEVVDGQKMDADAEVRKLASAIVAMEKEMSELKKQIVGDRKIMEAANREKELLMKNAQKSLAIVTEQEAKISLKDIEKKRLEDYLNEMQSQTDRYLKEVKSGISEREALNAELTVAKRNIQQLEEAVKLKDGLIIEAKKKMSDAEGQTKIHVNLFEQVRQEKNKASKKLVESEDEIKELNHKLKVKMYEVEQLKEDMTIKENMLVKGEFVLQKLTKEKESIRLERINLTNDLKDLKERVNNLEQEERNLRKVLEISDDDRGRLLRDLNQAMKEKESLAAQISRRNDEINLLYEKVGILEDVLRKSEGHYKQRVDDIRLLKIEIKRLRQEKSLLSRTMDNIVDVRREMFHLEQDLTREKLKSRTLEDELSTPLNVHRWRQLEGSDPEAFELVNKVRLLQKRLITASEEAVKRENELVEAKEKIQDLETVLAKQPGSEILEKLHATQVTLREKMTKIKALKAELSMYENQISEYKLDLEYKHKALAEVKNKYFALKRREQKVRERERDVERERAFLPLLDAGTPGSKFVGGGFNLASSRQKV